VSPCLSQYVELLRHKIGGKKLEHFALLTVGHGVKYHLINVGDKYSVSADLDGMIRLANYDSAGGIVLAHNHVDCSVNPSLSDDYFTVKAERLAWWHGIELLDHVIVGQQGYFSYAEDGRLCNMYHYVGVNDERV
jgi:DNA repair protein RadC